MKRLMPVNFFTALALIVLVSFMTAGCDLAKNQLKPDRGANLEIQDFRDGLESRIGTEDKKEADSSIPDLQSYIARRGGDLKPMPLVTISVNRSVPLRDVLYELARQAEYDLELDPAIKGALIFTARDKPFDLVVERISEMAGLRYSFDDEILRIEMDRPYNKVYKIDYLNYVRNNKSSVRTNVSVVSGEGADTGSDFEASAESESDFWAELEANLEQIVAVEHKSLVTDFNPKLAVVSETPAAPVAPSPQAPMGDSSAEDSSGDTDSTVAPAAPPQPEAEAIVTVQPLPEEEEAEEEDGGGSGSGQEGEGAGKPSFKINKQAGLVSVYAGERTQKNVVDYLRLVKEATTAQVLIEAKILEVALRDEFDAGIDWRALRLLSGEGLLQFGSDSIIGGPIHSISRSAGSQGTGQDFIVGYLGHDIQAVVSALSEFGTTRALASPRLTVLNNQSAVLNVADNRVFFTIDVEVTEDSETNETETDFDVEIHNVPEGVLVNVQPSINLRDQTISMALRPTVTRVIREVPDPAAQFMVAQYGLSGDLVSLVPEVNVQEIDSVIQVRSGQPIVMGGLLQDSSRTIEGGVPVLSEIPLMGAMFRSQNDVVQKTELVILLKATIVESYDNIHDTDRDIYKKFSGDRRPFRL